MGPAWARTPVPAGGAATRGVARRAPEAVRPVRAAAAPARPPRRRAQGLLLAPGPRPCFRATIHRLVSARRRAWRRAGPAPPRTSRLRGRGKPLGAARVRLPRAKPARQAAAAVGVALAPGVPLEFDPRELDVVLDPLGVVEDLFGRGSGVEAPRAPPSLPPSSACQRPRFAPPTFPVEQPSAAACKNLRGSRPSKCVYRRRAPSSGPSALRAMNTVAATAATAPISSNDRRALRPFDRCSARQHKKLTLRARLAM